MSSFLQSSSGELRSRERKSPDLLAYRFELTRNRYRWQGDCHGDSEHPCSRAGLWLPARELKALSNSNS